MPSSRILFGYETDSLAKRKKDSDMKSSRKGLALLPRYPLNHYRGSGAGGLLSLLKALFINRILVRHLPNVIKGSEHVICPLCGWHGRYFLPYIGGGHVKFNQYCPGCESHARHRGHRILYERILKCAEWKGRLLYFAPEPCVLAFLRSSVSLLRIVTVDYSMGGVECRVDILNAPFRDRSYDLILCHHVIEHVRDDYRALREVKRILKEGGKAILSVPIDLESPSTLEWGKPNALFDDHYYRYGMDFKERLGRVFPSVEEFAFSKVFTEQERRLHGIDESVVYVCGY